jgi:hypothetical protein
MRTLEKVKAKLGKRQAKHPEEVVAVGMVSHRMWLWRTVATMRTRTVRAKCSVSVIYGPVCWEWSMRGIAIEYGSDGRC